MRTSRKQSTVDSGPHMNLGKNLETLFNAAQIQHRIRELGDQIRRDYDGKELIMVCVLKGGFVFAADLVRQIDLPLAVDFIGLSSYGEATESSGVVKITSDLTKPIEGKHVLVVEDIVDPGLTMRYLLDNLATRHPASVKICALLSKPSRARARIPIRYLGFEVPDQFVVGYGLDAGEKFRNVPFVGVVKAVGDS